MHWMEVSRSFLLCVSLPYLLTVQRFFFLFCHLHFLSQSKAPSVQPLFLVLLRLWSPGRRRQRHHRRPHAVCAPSFIDLLTLGLVKRIYQRKKKGTAPSLSVACVRRSPPPQSVLWIALFILIEGSASAATVPGAGPVVLAGPASATPPPPLALRQLRLSVHRSG